MVDKQEVGQEGRASACGTGLSPTAEPLRVSSAVAASIPDAGHGSYCDIRIVIRDDVESPWNFDAENTVKQVWMNMIPWFTNRHGVRSGRVTMNDGHGSLEWRYANFDEDDFEEGEIG